MNKMATCAADNPMIGLCAYQLFVLNGQYLYLSMFQPVYFGSHTLYITANLGANQVVMFHISISIYSGFKSSRSPQQTTEILNVFYGNTQFTGRGLCICVSRNRFI